MARNFFRKVGFGLGPDETIPADPLSWAQAQCAEPQPLIWPGRLFSEQEMLNIRSDFTTEEQKIQRTIRDETEQKRQREALYIRSGRGYFESYELAIRHYQAVHGPAPVFERLVHFWGNHFTIVDKNKLAEFNTGALQRDTIRSALGGSIEELVYQVTISWPMLKSLDNFLSRGPNSSFNRGRRERNMEVKSLNENHARELLELHTLSPAGGYSQTDVIETAKIMSGWGFLRDGKKGERVESRLVGFTASVHEPGVQTVLGKEYHDKQNFNQKTKGKSKLRQLVADLVRHPACIDFISAKLCQHFITDNPTPQMIAPVKEAWHKSDGHLPTIHQAVMAVAWEFADETRKFQAAETWFLQSARILGLDWPMAPQNFTTEFAAKPTRDQLAPQRLLRELGHLPFRAKQPNGFPDTEAEWMSPEYLIRRLGVARRMTELLKLDTGPALPSAYLKAVLARNFEDSDRLAQLLRLSGEDRLDSRIMLLICSPEGLQA